MDFIERWLHISPDGGNGSSEFLILAALGVILISIGVVAFRGNIPGSFIKYLGQFGKREHSDRFDN